MVWLGIAWSRRLIIFETYNWLRMSLPRPIKCKYFKNKSFENTQIIKLKKYYYGKLLNHKVGTSCKLILKGSYRIEVNNPLYK